jgi:4-carboxymuconolactone decarboxylase
MLGCPIDRHTTDRKDAQMNEKFDTGMQVRRNVLGDAHVDRAEAGKTDFDSPFQTLITEGAWGTLWADDSISRRERSMLTLALLAATGNFDEIPMHIRATQNTGASPEDVIQAFMHVAVYAGVPKANHAIKLAKDTYKDLGVDV